MLDLVQDYSDSDDISVLLNRRWVKRVRVVPIYLGAWTILLGLLVLVGWRYEITFLKSVSSEWVSTKPIVAVSLILIGGSILLQSVRTRLPYSWEVILGKIMAIGSIVIGFYDLRDYRLLANSPTGESLGIIPIRNVAPLTAITLILLGVALLSLGRGILRRHPLSHWLASVVLLFSTLPLIGYLYGTPFQMSLGIYCDMAVPTALGFFAIGVATLFWRIDHDLAAVIVSYGPGGFMARRLIPVSVLILLILGWFRVKGEMLHLVSLSFGTAIFTTASIALTVGFIWQQSIVLQKAELRRKVIDDERERLRIEGEMRDQFISMLSHDLRTPMTAALMQAQMIARRSDNTDLCKNGALQIDRSLRRLDGMVVNILDASRVHAGQPVSINAQACELIPMIEETIEELSLIHGKRFVTELRGPLMGVWDAKAIRRVVENLCNNAVKYGSETTPIKVLAQLTEGTFILQVHNQGNEIPIENQTKLFDLFQRAGEDKKFRHTGWGIGLGLVRAIAEAHGGNVGVESGKEGTTFTFQIPASS